MTVGSLVVGAGAGEPDGGGGGAAYHEVLVGLVHPELEAGAEVPPVDQDAEVGAVHHGGGGGGHKEHGARSHHNLTMGNTQHSVKSSRGIDGYAQQLMVWLEVWIRNAECILGQPIEFSGLCIVCKRIAFRHR